MRVLTIAELSFVAGGDYGGGGGGDSGPQIDIPDDFWSDYNNSWELTDENGNVVASSDDVVVVGDPSSLADNSGLLSLANEMDNISDGMGAAADFGSAATLYLKATAGAQGGVDVPNDAAAAGAFAATIGAYAGKWSASLIAKGLRAYAEP